MTPEQEKMLQRIDARTDYMVNEKDVAGQIIGANARAGWLANAFAPAVLARLGALEAVLDKLLSGSTDPDAIRKAAQAGAADALAGYQLTLEPKDGAK